MKHKIGFNRLSRKASHRKALIKNMVSSLLKYEQITTTKAKALAVRSVTEKIITRAKEDSVHNRRIIGARITDEAILAKLFTDIGPRFKQRPGGYTRILKVGSRQGDAAEMVILELVEKVVAEKKPAKEAKANDQAEKPSEEKPKAKASKDKPAETEPKAKTATAKTPRAKKAETAESK